MRLLQIFTLLMLSVSQLNAQCVASVTANASNSNANEVIFTDQSSAPQNATIILTTGDGSTYTLNSFLNTITHLYTQPGAYEYCITIIDTITPCSDTYCDSVYINTNGGGGTAVCDAYFNYSTQASAYDYTFTSLGNSNVQVTHLWEFGDGNTSSAVNPTHTYSSQGSYTVCHTVMDVAGQCMDLACDYIIVDPGNSSGPCQSSFYWYQDSTLSQTVSMINNASGTALAYYWDFGDGNTSQQAYPTHTYANTGVYYVCLTIVDATQNMTCTSVYCDSVWVTFKAQGFTINVYPAETADISDSEDQRTILYPNPVKDKLKISDLKPGVSVSLYDSKGRCMIPELAVQSQNLSIDFSPFESGIYLLKIGEKTTRIIKE